MADTKNNHVTDKSFERCLAAVSWEGRKNQGNVIKGNRYLGNRQDAAVQNGGEGPPKRTQPS